MSDKVVSEDESMSTENSQSDIEMQDSETYPPGSVKKNNVVVVPNFTQCVQVRVLMEDYFKVNEGLEVFSTSVTLQGCTYKAFLMLDQEPFVLVILLDPKPSQFVIMKKLLKNTMKSRKNIILDMMCFHKTLVGFYTEGLFTPFQDKSTSF